MMANRNEVQSNEKRNGVTSPLQRIDDLAVLPMKSPISQVFVTVVDIEYLVSCQSIMFFFFFLSEHNLWPETS